MSKILSVDIEKCTGCKACELACSLKHEGEYNPIKSRIHVAKFAKTLYSVPVACFQCEEAWCEKVCPTSTIKTMIDAEKGIRLVEIDSNRCVGCKICLLACPFGNIGFSNGRAVKCDLCDGNPECVQVCVAGALKFTEAEVSTAKKWQSTAEKILASHQT